MMRGRDAAEHRQDMDHRPGHRRRGLQQWRQDFDPDEDLGVPELPGRAQDPRPLVPALVAALRVGHIQNRGQLGPEASRCGSGDRRGPQAGIDAEHWPHAVV
eukprot:13094274-Alexandrium_andersonii.AAC.1